MLKLRDAGVYIYKGQHVTGRGREFSIHTLRGKNKTTKMADKANLVRFIFPKILSDLQFVLGRRGGADVFSFLTNTNRRAWATCGNIDKFRVR